MAIADLLDRLPSPIALPLQSYLEETDPRLRLWAMCDSVELLLRLLVFVGIADLARSDGRPPQALRKALRKHIERPTLGGWADMAETVAQTPGTQTDGLFPELTLLVQHTLLPLLDGDGERSTERTSLLHLRNFLAHAGGVRPTLAETLFAAWREPFEQAMEGLAWLSELELVVQRPDGYGCLRGPAPAPSPYTPCNLATVAEALALADAVAVVRGETALPLWPLVLYGPPYNPYGDYPSEDSVLQLYRRQEDVHLQYTPLDGVVCHSQAGDAALARFQELFHVDREPSRPGRSRFTVRDFRDRIRSLADRLVGRTVELATLRGVLDATPEGVIWVAGTAGIGKSSLLARIAQDHLDKPPLNTRVLPYWFDAGDERCQRETFLRFAIERLQDWLQIPPPEDGQESPKPLPHLRDLLQHLDGRRVWFVLDGLDEITGRDAHFARDVPLALRLPGVVWLCAGRPEQGLPQWFRPEIAHHPFPDGLPPMREGDIREMLLDHLTGALRKRLVGQDRERGDQVINPFIANVAKAADGLPLYVRYVINDIWAGRYRMLDAGERLPPRLNAYHEDHLRRCAVSSLHQILTPMVALLAVAHDEPTVEILAALLRQRTLIPAGEEGVALVRSGLNALESMVRRKRDEDGRVCYALHHHSLRQHIQESPLTRQAVTTAREFLGDAALQVKPDAAAPYLYRYGIDHLVEDGARRHQDALRLLTRFDYLMARFHALQDTPVAVDLRTDWQTYRRTGGWLDDAARIWEAFFRENEHILGRGDDDWPAYKILLQRAIEHADDSPITQQAEAWLAQPGNCDWVWLRNPCRPEHVPVNPVVRVFEGHADTVNGVTILSDGRILSWSEDCTLRIWDRDDPDVFIEMEGHTHAVTGAKELADQKIVSCSNDGTLRFWDSSNGKELSKWQIDTKEGSELANQILKDNEIKPAEGEGEGEKVDSFACKVLNAMINDLGTNSLTRVHVLSERYRILELDFSMVGALWLLDCTDINNPVIRKLPNQYGATIKIVSDDQVLVFQGINIWIWHISSELELMDYQSTGGIRVSYSDNYHWELQETRIINIHQHFSSPQIALITDGLVLSKNWNTVGLWDLDTGKNIVVSPILPAINDPIMYEVELLNNGCFLIGIEDADILWDKKNFYWLKGRYRAQLPDTNLLCRDDNLQICSNITGEILKEIKGYKPIKDANLLPNGHIISWSEEENVLRLWDAKTGECIRILEGHTDIVHGAEMTHDGHIISWSKDHTIRLWNAVNGECIKVLEGHKDAIISVKFLPNNRILSASKDKTLCLWDVNDYHLIYTIKTETNNDEGFSLFMFQNYYELNNGNLLLNFSNLLYLLNGNENRLIAMIPASLAETKHFASGEKIKILNNSNILIWSNNSYSEFAPRIISGSTGKILPIGKNGQFIEKFGIGKETIYFLLNDGSFRVQNINIDEENYINDGLKNRLIPNYKSSTYRFPAVFNILGNTIGNSVKFIDHPMRWEAECAVVCKDISDDGTYIVSAADGRVLCLKLYRGSKRITCDELTDDHVGARTR